MDTGSGFFLEQGLEPLLRLLLGGQVLREAENAILAVPPLDPEPGLDGHEAAILAHQRQRAAILVAPGDAGEDLLGLLALAGRT